MKQMTRNVYAAAYGVMRPLVVFFAMCCASHSVTAGPLVVRAVPLETPQRHRLQPTRVLDAVQVTDPVKPDGVFDEKCWRVGRWVREFYEGKGALPARYPPQTKIAFDSEHLYLAFRCPEDKLDSLRLLRSQRDDPKLWNDDCVEIYLDANRDGATMFHFMINANGVVADAAAVETPEPDPAAGIPGVYVYRMKSDLSWNAHVHTGASRGNGEWRLEVSLPARDLGIGQIIPGTTMGITICRERYAGPRCSALASLRPNAWAARVWTYPELRLGTPLVQAVADLPTGIGQSECRLTLTSRLKRTSNARIEFLARSARTIRLRRNVKLAPGRPVELRLPYRLEGKQYDLRLRGRLADGRAFLDRRVAGPMRPAVALKVVEHARFVGEPYTHVRVELNLGTVTRKAARLRLAVVNSSGQTVAAQSLMPPVAQGEVEFTLNTGAILKEGRYAVECAVLQRGGIELGRATGMVDLVTPPDYGLSKETSK